MVLKLHKLKILTIHIYLYPNPIWSFLDLSPTTFLQPFDQSKEYSHNEYALLLFLGICMCGAKILFGPPH